MTSFLISAIFISKGKFHSFEEDAMVGVIFIDVFCDCHESVDIWNLLIYLFQKKTIVYWRREKLKDLEYFYLEPGAGSHVVVIVWCIFLYVLKDGHELWDQNFIAFRSNDFYSTFE